MSAPLPTKARCVPCDGRGCDACGKRGWVLAVLLMTCPRCEGTQEIEGLVRREVRFGSQLARTYVGSVPCPGCHGLGTIPQPCVMSGIDGCREPAVRLHDDPVCAAHDTCEGCEEEWRAGGPFPAAPVLGERHCERHLVAPVTAAA